MAMFTIWKTGDQAVKSGNHPYDGTLGAWKVFPSGNHIPIDTISTEIDLVIEAFATICRPTII